MPTAEVLAHEDGPFDTPHGYVLAQGQAFAPAAVCVLFDGTDAVGPFLACCSLYSQDGILLARTFPDTVAAGDTARVTFSPFAISRGGGGGIKFTNTPDQQAGKDLALLASEFFDVTVNNGAGSHCELFMLAIPPQSVLRLSGGEKPGDLVVIDAGGGLLQIIALGSSGAAGQVLTADGAGNCAWV